MKHRIKVIALVLLVATLTLGQGTVPPNVTQSQNPQSDQDARISAVPLVGRLDVHRGRTIRVDGTDVEEGSTILDGQTLETSECTSATVELLPVGMIAPQIVELGQVDLATDTKMVIRYRAGYVQAVLEKGCARVRNVPALEGNISTPDGRTYPATGLDRHNRRTVEICYPQDVKETFDPSCVPPILWVVGGAGAATAAVIVAGVDSRGDNPSPVTP